jgi:zinc protease
VFRTVSKAALPVFCALALLSNGVPAPAAAPDSGVTRVTLKNGLEVVVVRDALAPVVATWLNYRVGADEEPLTGIAHAQEHMMFRGSQTLSASQFHETTAITGGNFDADTQSAITQYFFEVPAQYLDIALNLEASRARGILDRQALWDQERGAIMQEVTQDNSNAVYRLLDKAVQRIFAGTPYADLGLGTIASFKRIQAPDLKAFYAKWYRPNNAVYVIAGDVDPEATIAKVRALFEKIPAKALPARPRIDLRPLTPATLKDDSDQPYTYGILAYRVPGYQSADYFATTILNDILNNPRGALGELRFSGKALQTFTAPITYLQAGMVLVGSIVPVTTPGQQAVDDIKAVLENYKKTGLPADLVEVAKQREIAQTEEQRNSISNLASLWSQTLAVENRTPDQELAGLQKVSVDDVNRVLRTYFDDATATALIATPKSANPTGGLGKASEDNTVVPTEHQPLPPFAKKILANLTVPDLKAAPVATVLPNNLKLVVVPEPYSHSVVVTGKIETNPGLEDLAGKDGVDDIVAGLLPFGTTTYDRVALQTELDKIAADVSPGPSFSLNVLSSNFERGMELLADEQLHPAFSQAAFGIVKQQTVGALTGSVKSPDFLAGQALLKALYPDGDPSRRYATPETAATVTLDDVKAQFAATYRPDLTTIAVVGDVTPERAQAAVAKYFGGWTASGPAPQVEPSPVPDNKAAAADVPATGRIQSSVALAQTVPIARSNPDYPLLRLANTVLTGGFYASLLYHDLRELRGYVYYVGSELSAGKTRGEFRVSYGCNPENIVRAQRLVVDDLTGLQRRGIPADRLLRSKALLMGELPLARESYDGLASELVSFASLDLPLDEDVREAHTVLSARSAQVQAALAKWVRPRDFVRVVTGPGPK